MIALGQITLYVRSMGKALRVIAIAESVAEANAYCAKHDAAAVVACLDHDRLILLADRYDPGTPIPREAKETACPSRLGEMQCELSAGHGRYHKHKAAGWEA